MRILLSTLCFLFIVSFCFAQKLNVAYFFDFTQGFKIESDADQNVYILGYFNDSIDADPTAGVQKIYKIDSVNYTLDYFLTKLDSNGNFCWAKTILYGSTFQAYPTFPRPLTNTSHNLHINNTTKEVIVVINQGNSYRNLRMLKFNFSGIEKMTVPIIKSSFPFTREITIPANSGILSDTSGNIYLAGGFNGSFDFDPDSIGTTILSASQFDVFISKYDSSGSLLWVKQIGSSSDEFPIGIRFNSKGNLLIMGNYESNLDVDPSSSGTMILSTSEESSFLVELDKQGNFVKGKEVIKNFVFDFNIDSKDDLIFSGFFRYYNKDSLNCSPSAPPIYIYNNYFPPPYLPSSATNGDNEFMVKTDSALNFKWVKRIKILPSYYGHHHLQVDEKDRIYFRTGVNTAFDDSLDLIDGPNRNFYNNYNRNELRATEIYVRLNPNGDYDWSHQFDGIIETQYIHYANNKLHFIAKSYNSIDIDPSPNTYQLNSLDSFGSIYAVWEFCENNAPITFGTVTACHGYLTNSNVYINTSGSYLLNLRDKNNCDSLVSLTVNIIPGADTIINLFGCDSALHNGQIYTRSGWHQDTIATAGQCDSVLKFFVTLNSTYQTTQNATVCDTFLWRGNNYTSTGFYADTFAGVKGCDSILSLDLIILNSTQHSLTINSCMPYLFAGTTYTSSGIYSNTFTNSVGCDSIVVLNLIVSSSVMLSANDTACYSYNFGGNTLTNSGLYRDTFLRANGCDSIVDLNLTIFKIDTSITTVNDSIISGQPIATGTFQWINCDDNTVVYNGSKNYIIPNTSANYKLTITTSNCTFTSNCFYFQLPVNVEEYSTIVTVYPNPFEDFIVLETNENLKDWKWHIIDTKGATLSQGVLNASENHEISVSDFAQGMYFLQLYDQNSELQYSRKLIKK